MNWKLIFQLSLFGFAMGLATVFFVSSKVEPALWIAIFALCAYLIARETDARRFLHGLCVGVANGAWITSIHIVFLAQYLAAHAGEAEMMRTSPLPGNPRIMMALIGSVAGVISGLILGLFALLAAKFTKKNKTEFVLPPAGYCR